MIDELKKSIDTEIEILREISNYTRAIEFSQGEEILLLKGAIISLKEALSILNDSIPLIMQERGSDEIRVSKLPQIPNKLKKEIPERKPILEEVEFVRNNSNFNVLLHRKDKERFLKELVISEEFIKKIKKRKLNKREELVEFKNSRGYLKLANKIFLGQSAKWLKKGYFKSLPMELRKANIDILLEVYVAMIFLSAALSMALSLIIFIALIFVDVTASFPFLSAYHGDFLTRVVRIIWIPIFIPILTFLTLYYYPVTEKKTIGRKIDQELPFAVIHMSAISGSGIAPVEIFKIIGLGKEYPTLRKEFRKVLNQINLFGYDLITALNNSAKSAPSEKLSELFSGLSTSVTSGADLKEFFEKRSETLLLNYRLEREKYTRTVETFLDIYISIVVAAPMIFMLLLVMILISGVDIQLTSFQISLIFVFGVALLNVVFLIFLQTKQPAY